MSLGNQYLHVGGIKIKMHRGILMLKKLTGFEMPVSSLLGFIFSEAEPVNDQHPLNLLALPLSELERHLCIFDLILQRLPPKYSASGNC